MTATTPVVTWAEVPDLPDFRVSTEGAVQVWSSTEVRWRPAQVRISKRYPMVMVPGTRRVWAVHHLVLLAFVGPRPTAHHFACHNNDVARDNRLSNLRWDTVRNNALDRNRLRGPKGCSPEVVKAVFTASGRLQEIADRFKVSKQLVANIVNRRCWVALTDGLVPGVRIDGRRNARPGSLTDDQVREVRRGLADGSGSVRKYAREFGTSNCTIWKVANGRVARHVTDVPCVRSIPMSDRCLVPVLAPGVCEVVPYRFSDPASFLLARSRCGGAVRFASWRRPVSNKDRQPWCAENGARLLPPADDTPDGTVVVTLSEEEDPRLHMLWVETHHWPFEEAVLPIPQLVAELSGGVSEPCTRGGVRLEALEAWVRLQDGVVHLPWSIRYMVRGLWGP